MNTDDSPGALYRSGRVSRGPKDREPGPYIRGPIGTVESPSPIAIGFCPWCGTNARNTVVVQSQYNCPHCVHAWWDFRVSTDREYTMEDFTSPA